MISVGNATQLATVGEIAARTGKRTHQIVYAVRLLGLATNIRAGRLRVFSDADVARIAAELKRIDAEKGANSC